MENEDKMVGNNKKIKKDDPVEEMNSATSKENLEERSDMKRIEDHPMNAKIVNIDVEDLTEEQSEGRKKEVHGVDDPLLFADCSHGIPISAQRLRQFKDDRYAQFTSPQREVFEEVVEAVKAGRGGCFFVEARSGRVKLDLLNAILAAVRLEEDAVVRDHALATSSLQLASHLLLGGRTFHYMFNASLNVTEDPNLQITEGFSLAEIIGRAKVIVVDEAVYLDNLHFEQLDDKLRDIADSEKVFGGKVIVLAGDFRQLLPIVKKNDLTSLINRSSLWSKFKVFTLRAREEKSSDEGLDQFDEWLQKLGNGDLPIVTAPGLDHHEDFIKLPRNMCIELQKEEESLKSLIQFVFPSFDKNIHKCAILAPKNDDVEKINDACMRHMPGMIETCISVEPLTECTSHSNNSNTCPCSRNMLDEPTHCLKLKRGVPLILLSTLQTKDHYTGTSLTLSTGTRLTLEDVLKEHLTCTLEGGRIAVSIERVELPTAKSCDGPRDGRVRNQFPVTVAFATTIHKSQGLMLKRVGVWLKEDVFAHGQLYAAASCVARREDIRFVLPKRGVPSCYATRNIVNKEVFHAPVPAHST